MPEVIGIDHVFIAVSDMARSEQYYDVLMETLEFRKNKFDFSGDLHIQYYNRHFGFVLRPARTNSKCDPYSPGMHHLCLRVETGEEVSEIAKLLHDRNIETSEPKQYPEYAPDYYAIFLEDPDGTRLEVTNYRQERRERNENW